MAQVSLERVRTINRGQRIMLILAIMRSVNVLKPKCRTSSMNLGMEETKLAGIISHSDSYQELYVPVRHVSTYIVL